MSGEHIIAKSVIKAIQEFDKTLSFGSVNPRMNRRPFSIGSATVRSLCVTHNRALSPLDTEAARFTKAALRAIDPDHVKEVNEGRAQPEFERFDGALLERWALKTYLNMFLARDPTGIEPAKVFVPVAGEKIIDAVFNGAPLPHKQGIYALGRPEPKYAPGGNPLNSPFAYQFVLAEKRLPHETKAGVIELVWSAPAYMVLSLGPLEFMLCANVTELSDSDWRDGLHGLRSANRLPPEAYFHPPMVILESLDESATENAIRIERASYTPWSNPEPIKGSPTVTMQINWPNDTASYSPPGSVVLNRWIRRFEEWRAENAARVQSR